VVGVTDVRVAGLGRIGLPPAVQFADKGHPGTGADIAAEAVAAVAAPRLYRDDELAHPDCRELGAADFPGGRVLLDGPRVTDPARWEGVRRIVPGGGS